MNLDEMMNRKRLLKEQTTASGWEDDDDDEEEVKDYGPPKDEYADKDKSERLREHPKSQEQENVRDTESRYDEEEPTEKPTGPENIISEFESGEISGISDTLDGLPSDFKEKLLNYVRKLVLDPYGIHKPSDLEQFLQFSLENFKDNFENLNLSKSEINLFIHNYNEFRISTIEILDKIKLEMNHFRGGSISEKESITVSIKEMINSLLRKFQGLFVKFGKLTDIEEKEFKHPSFTRLKNALSDISNRIYKIYDGEERDKYLQELKNNYAEKSKTIEELVNNEEELEANLVVSKFEEYWSNIVKTEKSKKTPKELDRLSKIYNKAREQLSLRYVDDPEGLQVAIDELDADFQRAASSIAMYVEEADQITSDEFISTEDFVKRTTERAIKSGNAIDEISAFKSEWLDQEDVLRENEFWNKKKYSDMFAQYMSEALSLPGIPASAYDTFRALTSYQTRFAGSRNRYANLQDSVNDQELVKQVAHGVKPLAHVKSHRRELILNQEETDYLAFVLAPSRMGGGTIWYRPYRTANERPYSKELLTPETEKESRGTARKPYDPHAYDKNLEIVRLYIWNNIANRSDPKIYNFINGLCLGYPRDFVIWFCESEYGQRDYRNPEKGLFGRLIDRAIYCIRGNVDGYGRPGTIEPDGMFSSLFKMLTPKGLHNFISHALRTSEPTGPYRDFVSASKGFSPATDAPKLKVDDEEDVDIGFIDSLENIMGS